MTTNELWTLLWPVTWLAWGTFASMMIALVLMVWQRASMPPGYVERLAKIMRRGQFTFFGIFVLSILLFWWDVASPWQGVEFYARTFLPIWLMCVIAAFVLPWCARTRPRRPERP